MDRPSPARKNFSLAAGLMALGALASAPFRGFERAACNPHQGRGHGGKHTPKLSLAEKRAQRRTERHSRRSARRPAIQARQARQSSNRWRHYVDSHRHRAHRLIPV